jgi:hypothetical protein
LQLGVLNNNTLSWFLCYLCEQDTYIHKYDFLGRPFHRMVMKPDISSPFAGHLSHIILEKCSIPSTWSQPVSQAGNCAHRVSQHSGQCTMDDLLESDTVCFLHLLNFAWYPSNTRSVQNMPWITSFVSESTQNSSSSVVDSCRESVLVFLLGFSGSPQYLLTRLLTE